MVLSRSMKHKNFGPPHFAPKSYKNPGFLTEIRDNYGCGGRTRTYDLRVMSPTSFQLLYSAIFH